MQTVEMKFGSSSVGNADAIRRVVQIAHRQQPLTANLIIVVSAMGGVTDQLIRCATLAAANQSEDVNNTITAIRSRHVEAIEALVPAGQARDLASTRINERLEELTRYCQSILVMGEVTPRGMDVISSLGKRMSAPLVAAALQADGLAAQAVEATRLIVTDRTFQNAVPQMGASR